MTEEVVLAALKEFFKHEDGSAYVDWDFGDDSVCLDGYFDMTELAQLITQRLENP